MQGAKKKKWTKSVTVAGAPHLEKFQVEVGPKENILGKC